MGIGWLQLRGSPAELYHFPFKSFLLEESQSFAINHHVFKKIYIFLILHTILLCLSFFQPCLVCLASSHFWRELPRRYISHKIVFNIWTEFVDQHKWIEFIQPLQFIRSRSVKQGLTCGLGVFFSPISSLSSSNFPKRKKKKIPKAHKNS